jgi:hypothetical protein
VSGIAVQFIVSGAAGALFVAAASGVRSVAAQRAPRRRVEAIRAAQECLTVLGADHPATEAVATHQQQEAAALAALVRRKALSPRRWAALGVVTGVFTLGVLLLAVGAWLIVTVAPADTARSALSGGFVGTALGLLGLFIRFIYRLIRNWRHLESDPPDEPEPEPEPVARPPVGAERGTDDDVRSQRSDAARS